MKEGVIVIEWQEREFGDICGIVREMEILGGKRIVEGTGNFRKEWRIVGKTQTVGEPGNCGKKEEKINFLKSYTVIELLHKCLSPPKRIKIP